MTYLNQFKDCIKETSCFRGGIHSVYYMLKEYKTPAFHGQNALSRPQQWGRVVMRWSRIFFALAALWTVYMWVANGGQSVVAVQILMALVGLGALTWSFGYLSQRMCENVFIKKCLADADSRRLRAVSVTES